MEVKIEEQQPYRQRTYTWCWAFPPRCSKYKIQIRKIYRTEVRKASGGPNLKVLQFISLVLFPVSILPIIIRARIAGSSGCSRIKTGNIAHAK